MLLLSAYALVAVLIIGCLARSRPGDFPVISLVQFRLRIDAPDGTRVAVTEGLVQTSRGRHPGGRRG